MKFPATIASLSLSLGLASAFHIPEGTPDGVYSVHTYHNGTEIHTRLTTPGAGASARQLRKRQGSYFQGAPQCYGGDEGGELDHGNTDTANANLQYQCGGGAEIDPGDDFYSIAGNTVAYACNFGGTDDYTFCFSSTSVQANQIITNGNGDGNPGCGEYQPGSIEDVNYLVAYGYENYGSAKGNNFCGRGTQG
ncbi:hypothetical protein PRZ48_013131 [Zasmidium cellare]|uniref:Uncharacterized protein n=1 Tax=Zasmidium cellare TaxID=395010 RepID=A0ABR0E3N4_ZASCE|nr:hypothetical protein PRZ48_013131 [Zasmidium cellare]